MFYLSRDAYSHIKLNVPICSKIQSIDFQFILPIYSLYDTHFTNSVLSN